MADRNIIIRLRAEIADFKKGMQEAAQSAASIGKSAGEGAAASKSPLSAMAKGIRDNKSEWDKISTSMMVAGGAMTGITAAVLKTGISYNTLRQTSTAALTTMMGSASKAADQMDRLDEFARSSPFAKQVFIEAQRQLIGFGMEAERVLPTLDAVQNAVAATGGSNQQISELVTIIAQIGAAGKITATDLMQFGQRGVDAATLIGSQMGKTGAQIREDITAGALGADEAIQALVAGMQERFGGAAAGVKDTFVGALDRVKGAIRDISSEFATIFVNPEGGGLLIGWTNTLADLLRAFQRLPDPIKNVTGATFALSGVALLTAGSTMKLVGSALEMRDSWMKLSKELPGVANGLKTVASTGAKLAAVVTVAALVSDSIKSMGRDSVPEVEGLTTALRGLANGAKELPDLGKLFENQNALPMFRDEITSTEDALKAFADQAEMALAGGWTDRLERFLGNGSLARFEEQARQLDSALAELATGGSPDQAAAAFKRFTDAAVAQGVPLEKLKEYFPQYAAAMEEAASSTGTLTQAQQEQQQAAQELADMHRDLASAIIATTQANMAAANAEIAYEETLAKSTETIKKNGAATDIATEKGRANRKSLLEQAAAAVRVAEDNLKAGASVDQVAASMDVAREAFIQNAIKAGYNAEEARKMANEWGLTREQVNNLSQAIDNVPTHKKTEIEADISKAMGAVGTIKTEIRNLQGRTVEINVRTVYTSIGTPGAHSASTRGGVIRGSAHGGPIYGPGTETSDSIPALLSHNEHVWSAREVKGAGGHAAMERMRMLARLGALPRFRDGGSPARLASYAPTVAPRAMFAAPPAAPSSLAGLQISGTLDTPFGPSQMRGMIVSELDTVARGVVGRY